MATIGHRRNGGDNAAVAALESTFRATGARVIAALAARFRDLTVAEDAFAEACARALDAWKRNGPPSDAAAWLYRVAERAAFDTLAKTRHHRSNPPEPPPPPPTIEEAMADDRWLVPDERLRLLLICCHPAVAVESRTALTLRLICGLSTGEIARAFLVEEAAIAQRLVRAKRKIAQAGVPFGLPAPEHWPERLQAVLTTIEVAYAKAHEDGAGAGRHAGFADEMRRLAVTLTTLMPDTGEVHALAALIHYAEARRPARTDNNGLMIPLSDQDPQRWRRPLIDAADRLLAEAERLTPDAPRTMQAALQRLWCARRSREEVPPWPAVLAHYDRLLALRDDPIVRLNRAVALAEVAGPAAALAAVDALPGQRLASFLPYHAVRADLLRRNSQPLAAREAYAAALSLDPPPAERQWLEQQAAACHPPVAAHSPQLA